MSEVDIESQKTVDKLSKFFKERCNENGMCPVCKNNEEWTISDNNDFEPLITAMPGKNNTLPKKLYGWFSIYICSCANCGFIRMHDKQFIDNEIEKFEGK